MIRFLSSRFQSLPPPYTASWIANKPADEYSAYHFYMKDGLRRWRQGLAPTMSFPNYETGTDPNVWTFALESQGYYVRLRFPFGWTAPTFAVYWHGGDAADFTPTPSNCIAIEHPTIVDREPIVDRVPGPGTYYYKIKMANATAKLILHWDTQNITIT